MPALRLRITGRVQGVFFRAHTKEKADELGLCGWARNCDDGSVEVHAEGSLDALRSLEEWCSRGPPAAAVERVDVQPAAEEECTAFVVRR